MGNKYTKRYTEEFKRLRKEVREQQQTIEILKKATVRSLGRCNGLCRREAHELLKAAPTPAKAARLTRAQLQAALKRAGRQRGIDAEAERLREVFRADWAHQPPLVEDALGKQTLALLIQLEAACTAADDLAKAVEETLVALGSRHSWLRSQSMEAETICSAWGP